MAVARVHVRSWQVAYRGMLPDEYLDGLRPQDRALMYHFADPDPFKPHTIVATDSASILGFATASKAREQAMTGYGELSALYVDPDHWNRGIGRGLIAAARARLVDIGFRNALLWILKGNTRADRFYRSDGWLPSARYRTEVVWSIVMEELQYIRGL